MVKDVMHTPVLCLRRHETVARIYLAVTRTHHTAFPVVDDFEETVIDVSQIVVQQSNNNRKKSLIITLVTSVFTV
jgi:CBS domain-containing protein